MATLVIGDVHGCSDELRKLWAAAREPDDIVLVGDLFTKGPDPVGVYELIRRHEMQAVRGNHDQRLLDVVEGQRPHDTHGHEVVAKLDADAPGWREWLADRPYVLEIAGWTVVHAALHPSGDLALTTPYTATVLRRWPDDAPDDPRWWAVYHGDRRVVFGHDARQGLVEAHPDAEGHPRVIGLDTGCVYGGRLTGRWLEEHRFVSVLAAQAYVAIR